MSERAAIKSAVSWERRLLMGIGMGLMLAAAACGVTPSGNPHGFKIDPSLSIFESDGAVRASDGTMRWTRDLGLDAPVIAGGVLYATMLQQMGTALSAVRATDGTVLWTYQTEAQLQPVAVAGSLAIVPTLQQGGLVLVALRAANGSVVWRSSPVAARTPPTVDTPVPFVSALAVTGGIIAATYSSTGDESFVAAWNATNGSLAWQHAITGGAAFAGAYGALKVTGTTLTMAYRSASQGQGMVVMGLNPTAGAAIWQSSMPIPSLDLVTASVLVFSDSAAGMVTGIRPQDGAILWQRAFGASTQQWLQEVAASDTAVYYRRYDPCGPTGDGMQKSACPHLYAVSLASGVLVWQRTLEAANPDFATNVLVGNGMLYYQFFYQMSGHTHFVLIALDSATGAVHWRRQTKTLFHYALVTSGAIVAAGLTYQQPCGLDLELLNGADGSLVWSRTYATCPAMMLRGGWIAVE